MSSRVRLLPTLIGATGVLLCLRIGAMAASQEPAADPANAAGDQAAAAPAQPEAPAAAEGAPADAAATGAPQQLAQATDPQQPSSTETEAVAQTKGEAEVLQKLGERRAELDAREKDLGLREQLLVAAERQLDSRLSELKQLEQKLDAMMTKRNEQEDAQIASLVKSYESMKPEDAARIFNRLERNILVDVSSRMKPAKIGAILAAMEPARAQDLTVLLAKRLKLNEAAAMAAPPPAPAAPAADAGASGAPGTASAPAAATPPNG
jgi:flagellar motility protein MotE (MotC chaperone)